MNINLKTKARLARKVRVRKRIKGTTVQPRLNVYRSAKHIYAQIIDDVTMKTLAAASSQSPELKGKSGGNKAGAKAVGELIAKKAIAAGVEKVVFDRNGFLYHGRVKILAEAAREGGLKF